MNRREFLMTTLAAFALSALPKLTFAETIPVSDAVKHKIDPKNKGFIYNISQKERRSFLRPFVIS